MKTQAKALFTVVALVCLIPAAAFAGIVDFSQDFETLNQAGLTALGNDGWLYYVTVFEAGTGTVLNGYGGAAPNTDNPVGISRIVIGEGGAEQGLQQLSVFSDYNNQAAHTAGDLLNTNVYKEFSVDSGDVGKVCTFEFQAKMGNLVAPSTALAFIKTLDPGNGYAETNLVTEVMTNLTTDWTGWSLELTIDAGLVDQLFQVGFANDATSGAGSSIIYDNVILSSEGGSSTGLAPYSQDFEALNAADLNALGNDGWLVFANIFDDVTGDPIGEYGPFAAPNNPAAPAFCNIATGEGGAEQGAQQMSVFSDYENAAVHTSGDILEAIVYREQTVQAGDVGDTWYFEFQAKTPAIGGVAAPATAEAFIKTLDPSAGYTMTNYVTQDMSAIGTEWSGWSLSLTIDSSLVGQLFQIGFANRAADYGPSSVIYDNISLYLGVSSVPGNDALAGAELRQNYPNPFNPMTRIEFSLEKSGRVNLAVYDVAGRLVTTLLSEDRASGDHFVTWNGTDRGGSPVAAGVYHYVMSTATGRTSRSMILLK